MDASHQSKKACGQIDEVEPLLHQPTAAMLSEPNHKNAGWSVCSLAKRADATRRAQSSKSLFVKQPDGLEAETRLVWLSLGKGSQKTVVDVGLRVVDSQMPPMPAPEASTAYMSRGAGL
jgi:hypothetical protein